MTSEPTEHDDRGESLIELRVRQLAELRAMWVDSFADGGIFVPGLLSVSAGARVVVHVRYALPAVGSVFLTGTVAYRRARAGASVAPRTSGTFVIQPGVAIAFDATMRARLLFLDRVERGASREERRNPRYPASLVGELVVRRSESPKAIQIADVGPHGARIVAPELVDSVRVGALARLWVGNDQSGASSFAPLAAQVVWVDRARGDALGLRMVLTSAEDRLHWARVFDRWRRAFETRRVDEQQRAPASHLR